MGKPSVSVRKHIRFPPGKSTEPTSTLVVNSHKSYFVDIRILTTTPENSIPDDLPNKGGEISRLDWAFAGVANATEPEHAGGPYHCVWKHWIDSRSSNPEPDEGTMFPQNGGNVLECGESVDPETGKVTKYEELWHDLHLRPAEGADEHISLVLKHGDRKDGSTGIIVRVGDWCQGILKVKDEISVERWHWDQMAAFATRQGMWMRIARLGQRQIGCNAAFHVEKLKEGGSVRTEGLKWDVVELYRWK